MKYKLLLSLAIGLLLTGCSVFNQQKPKEVILKVPVNNIVPSPEYKPIINILDLSNQKLKKVPDYVFKQTNLEELNLSNNQLTGAIQAEVRNLQNLRVLNLSNNQLTGVPAEIGQLQSLQQLNLSNNKLTGLPSELGNLKNLITLNIFGNNYSAADLKIITDKLPDLIILK